MLVVTRTESATECLDSDGLIDVVNRLTGKATVVSAKTLPPRVTPRVLLHVEVTAAAKGFRATLRMPGPEGGIRELTDLDPTCAELSAALGIAVVILLDSAPETEPKVPPGLRRTAPEVLVPPLPAALLPDAPARGPLRLGPEFLGGIAVSWLSDSAPLIMGGVVWRPVPRAVFGLGAGHAFEQRTTLGAGSLATSAEFGLARWCYVASGELATSTLELCVGGLVGSLRGRGQDFDHGTVRRLPWLALSGGVITEGHLGAGLVWSAFLLGLAPIVRQTFVATQPEATDAERSTPALGALLGLGVRWEVQP